MSGPRPPEVRLSAGQEAILERLARRATSPQRLVRRVTIILAAAAGRNNDQIARQYGLAREMVQTWRRRWLAAAPRLAAAEAGGSTAAELTQQIVAVLADAPRAGGPDLQRGADLPNPGAGVRAARGVGAAGDALDPSRVGRRSRPPGHRPPHLRPDRRAFFTQEAHSSRTARATG